MRDRVKEILKKTEADLRTLISESAVTADVRDIVWITDIVRQINRFAEEAEGKKSYTYDQMGLKDKTTEEKKSYDLSEPSLPGPELEFRQKKNIGQAGKKAASRRRQPKKGEYPKFYWENNGQTLVKVGWSKKKRLEYRHRAPRKILDLTQDKIDKLGANGKFFSMDDVLPLVDSENKQECSSYKVYICVSYLEQNGKIERSQEGIRLSN